MKIYKYELELTDVQTIQVPYRFQPLSVQFQGDNLCLWAMMNENSCDMVYKTITIIGTGNSIGRGPGVFIDTVQKNGFVWHIFIKDY